MVYYGGVAAAAREAGPTGGKVGGVAGWQPCHAVQKVPQQKLLCGTSANVESLVRCILLLLCKM